MQITEQDIKKIVQQVMENVTTELKDNNSNSNQIKAMKMKASSHTRDMNKSKMTEKTQPGDYGVFADVKDAIDAADWAQKELMRKYNKEDRENMLSAIRKKVLMEKEILAEMAIKETNLGNFADKLAKHELTVKKTPGTEDLTTQALSGDDGLTIIEQAPYGLIGGITPVTNPTTTIIHNSISMIAAGNSVVFNVHPSSKNTSAYLIKMINQAIIAAGGPNNLVTMAAEPNQETLQSIMDSDKVKMLVGTGGKGLVNLLLSSGKKTIGAGAGNPPVIVDDTADLEKAAQGIIEGATFDNNILCIAEKEVFVLEEVADTLIYQMINKGAYTLNNEELDILMQEVLVKNPDTKFSYNINKEYIGQDISIYLKLIGVEDPNIKLLIFEADFSHPLVHIEQMMPILPVVRVKDLDTAINYAIEAEGGNRHTASMFSTNVDNLTRFSREVQTTIFVKNAATLAGVGYKGEGSTTMTIAGPTGEGVTSAKSFTRSRRCVLAEGGFNIT